MNILISKNDYIPKSKLVYNMIWMMKQDFENFASFKWPHKIESKESKYYKKEELKNQAFI
jgi:hypothetical protein